MRNFLRLLTVTLTLTACSHATKAPEANDTSERKPNNVSSPLNPGDSGCQRFDALIAGYNLKQYLDQATTASCHVGAIKTENEFETLLDALDKKKAQFVSGINNSHLSYRRNALFAMLASGWKTSFTMVTETAKQTFLSIALQLPSDPNSFRVATYEITGEFRGQVVSFGK